MPESKNHSPENAVDPERFTQQRRHAAALPLRVAFVGRLVPYKGADILIRAAAELLREARRTFRDEPILAVQLAALLPPGSAEAEDLLESPLRAPEVSSSEPSPRYLYEDASTEGLSQRVAEFSHTVEQKLPDLIAALARIETLERQRKDPRRPTGSYIDRQVFRECSTFKIKKAR